MEQKDILISLGVSLATAAAGFVAGVIYTKKKYGIDDYEELFHEFYTDTDGDYHIVTPASTESDNPRMYTSIEKPDIFEIGEKVVEDYDKYAQAFEEKIVDISNKISTAEKIDTEITIEHENVFDTAERSSIISENTAKDLVADGYDTLTATYFPSDDVLAGFDDKLDQLDENEYGLEEAVNAIMNSENMSDSVFVRNDDEQIVYEVVVSHVSYEEAIEEVE